MAAVPEVTDTAVDCVETVLESGPYDREKNIEVMECYQAVAQDMRTCYAEKLADNCTNPSDCSMEATQTYEDCAGQLSANQIEAIFLCRTE